MRAIIRRGLLTMTTLAAVSAAGLFTAAPPGAAVQARTVAKPTPPVGSLAPPTAIMRAQIPLVRAADKIAATAKGRSGYTDITLSVRQHLVRVYWKMPLPGPVSHLIGQLRSPGVRIQVHAAPYTARQLNAEVRRLELGRGRYAARGVLLNRLAIRPDGTGIDVGIARSGAPRAAAPAALAGLRASTTIPLHFQPATAIHPMSGRLADTPPFWAGDRIRDALGDICTTGFPMRRTSDGRTFITTADHCDSPSHPVNEEWTTWSGGNRVGEAWYHVPNLDVAYIRPPNGAVAGGIYTGGIAPADQVNAFVKGVANNYVGLNVCSDGSYTVEACGIQTVDQETDWFPEDNAYVTFWAGTAGNCHCVATGNGDSGGPILTYGNGGVLANGSLSAGGGLYWTCTNDNNEAIHYCYNYVFWVDEQLILSWLGASLLTS